MLFSQKKCCITCCIVYIMTAQTIAIYLLCTCYQHKYFWLSSCVQALPQQGREKSTTHHPSSELQQRVSDRPQVLDHEIWCLLTEALNLSVSCWRVTDSTGGSGCPDIKRGTLCALGCWQPVLHKRIPGPKQNEQAGPVCLAKPDIFHNFVSKGIQGTLSWGSYQARVNNVYRENVCGFSFSSEVLERKIKFHEQFAHCWASTVHRQWKHVCQRQNSVQLFQNCGRSCTHPDHWQAPAADSHMKSEWNNILYMLLKHLYIAFNITMNIYSFSNALLYKMLH